MQTGLSDPGEERERLLLNRLGPVLACAPIIHSSGELNAPDSEAIAIAIVRVTGLRIGGPTLCCPSVFREEFRSERRN